MLLFLSIIIGLLVGIVRKGNIFRLGYLQLVWIAILPLVAVVLYKYYPGIPFWAKVVTTSISYLCVMMFVIANRKYTFAAAFMGLGTLCNYLVIAINSFRMPISARALLIYPTMTAEAVFSQRADYFVATDGAKLMFLGDVFYMPIKFLEGFFSVGDVILAIGMFFLIVQVMGKNKVERKKTQEDVN